MVSQPTVMLVIVPSDLMICGMKISMPRLAVDDAEIVQRQQQHLRIEHRLDHA